MRRRIIYEPTLGDAALLILRAGREIFIESFWPHPYYHTFCKHAKRQSFRNALQRLEKRGFIIGEQRKNRRVYILSKKGKKFADNIKLKFEMAKSRSWDGKWRVLIFDIPEKIRGKRDFLRKELREFGFYPLQKSVWAYPYNLPQDFLDLWDGFTFGKELILLESGTIKNDQEMRSYFGLR